MTAAAADAVFEWEELMDRLVSIHTERVDFVDWNEIADGTEPSQPTPIQTCELQARAALDSFQPKLLDVFTGGAAKRKTRLEDSLQAAIIADRDASHTAQQAYQDALTEWKADVALARRLLNGEPEAIRDVISEMQSLSDVAMLGTEINFRISGSGVHAIVLVHNDEIVPSIRRKQLASGRLSESKMPVGDFNELYQDYVCSAALRIGGDLLSLLPIPEIYVTCLASMLDSSTGHQKSTPILSIQIVRTTFDGLHLARIDPSDAMTKFNHAMNFKRAKGFSEIKPLKSLEDD